LATEWTGDAIQFSSKLILAGEPPYDIFVRWKPLSEQPVGRNPDPREVIASDVRP